LTYAPVNRPISDCTDAEVQFELRVAKLNTTVLSLPGSTIEFMKTFSARETAWLQELDGIELASFWRRAAALLIDGLIVGFVYSILLSTVVTIYVNRHPGSGIAINLAEASHKVIAHQRAEPAGHTVEDEVHRRLREGAVDVVQGVLVPILYFGTFLWQGNGRTPGKRFLKIRVVSLVHTHISFWHAAERALGYCAALLEGGFGFFQFFLHPYRRCAQDRLAETIVVTERSYRLKVLTRFGTPSEADNSPAESPECRDACESGSAVNSPGESTSQSLGSVGPYASA
jgi:uncharacterized RDD family membrane protein YckC